MRKIRFWAIIGLMVGVVTACGNPGSQVSQSSAENENKVEEVTERAAKENVESGKITIYLVRHGKTFFNTTGQVQGWVDSPLTETGEAQADAVGIGLADIQFTTAFSSDLGRQRLTAKRILDKNNHNTPELNEIIGLREWFYGGYEGKTNAEMWIPIFEGCGLEFDEEWSQYTALTKLMNDGDIADAIAANDKLGAAESYEEIVKRSQEALDEMIRLTEQAGGGNILAVSSGSEIPTLLEIATPGEYQGTGISNCSVTILTYENGAFTLETAGDMSYLEAGQK